MPRSPLLPGDHYVLVKLSNEVLPLMISGSLVTKQMFVRVATIDAYAGDLTAAFAALGIGGPFIAIATGKLAAGTSAIDVLHSALPGTWFTLGVIALVIWVVLRVVVTREDVAKRAIYARACADTMDELYADLQVALPGRDPMPAIVEIQKSLVAAQKVARKNRVWKWRFEAPAELIEAELKRQVREIRAKYMHGWAPPPQGVM